MRCNSIDNSGQTANTVTQERIVVGCSELVEIRTRVEKFTTTFKVKRSIVKVTM